MITVEEAQSKISNLLPEVGSETIRLENAAGRVLKSSVTAQRDQPPFAASAMDGYAIRQEDLKVGAQLHVIGENAAGHSTTLKVNENQAVRIFTGAPLPTGSDYILIQEDTECQDDFITVKADHDTASYVRPAGGDFPKGFKINAPKKITPSDFALLASMNAAEIEVAKKPVVALIPTGDELVWPGEAPRDDQIITSNNFGLKAMLEAEGADVRLLPIASDTPDSLKHVFELTEGVDLIVTLGGASVGDHDLVKDVAKGEGLDLSFYKLAMRPGKPLMAGLFGGTPMIGLPGNPVSSMVCGQIFLRPAIRAMQGLGYQNDPVFNAVLDKDIGPNGPRAHYMRANVALSEDGWRCSPFERQDSSLLTVLSDANALMIRPAHDPAQSAGSVVKFTHL